ncbi:MAG: hypothetical protein V7723_19725, partial [Sneathiella sp.]|uniref:hypothetical protein n=1 Tax=Sneathiella sp. TaxID=1964365 RepID=UPI00305FB223
RLSFRDRYEGILWQVHSITDACFISWHKRAKKQNLKSPASAQGSLNIQAATYSYFYFQHHFTSRTCLKEYRAEAFRQVQTKLPKYIH